MLRDSEKRRIYDQVSSCLYWALLLGAVHGVFMPDSVWCCACSAATFKQVASMTRSAAAAGCSALEGAVCCAACHRATLCLAALQLRLFLGSCSWACTLPAALQWQAN